MGCHRRRHRDVVWHRHIDNIAQCLRDVGRRAIDFKQAVGDLRETAEILQRALVEIVHHNIHGYRLHSVVVHVRHDNCRERLHALLVADVVIAIPGNGRCVIGRGNGHGG